MTTRSLSYVRNRRQPTWKDVRQRDAVRVGGGKSACQVVVVLPFEIVISTPVTVELRHVLDNVLVRHSLRAPRPAVPADLAAHIEVVKQYKALGEGVLVWRHIRSKQH